MSLRNRTRNMPRDLPPIDVPRNIEYVGGSIGDTKHPLKEILHRGIKIPTPGDVGSPPSDIQDPVNRSNSSENDYVETDFRYLTIGSPVPISGLDQTGHIPDEVRNSDKFFDSMHLEQTSSGRHHGPNDVEKRRNNAVTGARRKDASRRADPFSNPAIKVDCCEAGANSMDHIGIDDENISPDNSADDSSKGDESPGRGIESPSHGTLLLTPTQSLCQKRHKAKLVTYYQPSLTCSKSEGSIREAVRKDQRSNEGSTECMTLDAVSTRFTSHSHGNIRSHPSSPPISVFNTQVLLSPQSHTREGLLGTFARTSESRVSHDSLSLISPMSTPSPFVSPLSSPASRRRPDGPGHSRTFGEAKDGHLPNI